MNQTLGKYLIILGVIIVIVGIIVYFFSSKLHWLGHLPGDINYQNKNVRFSFPIVTMLIISLLLNAIVYLIRKLL